jgi:uncharacterized Zn finger protein
MNHPDDVQADPVFPEAPPPTGLQLLPQEYNLLGWYSKALLTQLVDLTPDPILTEALELDRRRRATILQIQPGVITAAVRESSNRPNRIEINTEVIGKELWARVLELALEHHALCAQMLAGFVPEELEKLAAGQGVSLVPPLGNVVCKPRHPDGLLLTRAGVATLLSLARYLETAPTSMLTLRGMHADEALERLHQRQSLRQSVSGDAPAYVQRPIQTDTPAPPLEMCLENFWDAGEALDHIDTTPRFPEVECPLLRRLGPSPFSNAKFPLLGFLATCYDQIARAQIESEAIHGEPGTSSG